MYGDKMEKIRFQICEKEMCIRDSHKITESQAKDLMIKTDKKRSSYYNYYSSKRWGDSKSYDLCMNSSKIGYDGVVKMIQDFVEIKKGYKK